MVQINKKWLVSFTLFVLMLNSLLFLSGLIYLLLPTNNYIWRINGVLIIITLLSNFLIFNFLRNKIDKQNKLGKKINILVYLYYLLIIPALLLMFVGNLLKSVTYSNLISQNIGAFLLIGVGYFGILLFGWIILFLSLIGSRNSELWKKKEPELEIQQVKRNGDTNAIKGVLGILSG